MQRFGHEGETAQLHSPDLFTDPSTAAGLEVVSETFDHQQSGASDGPAVSGSPASATTPPSAAGHI
jgi:hypothetical protein